MKDIGHGLFLDESPDMNIRCEWKNEGFECFNKYSYIDMAGSPETMLCREHALWIKGKHEKWGIGDKKEPAGLKIGGKYCHQCRKTYDGNYILHKPNCYKR